MLLSASDVVVAACIACAAAMRLVCLPQFQTLRKTSQHRLVTCQHAAPTCLARLRAGLAYENGVQAPARVAGPGRRVTIT